ncbi:hypothetical protein R1sor_018252 [Riccia sorocarpa]|uniref:FCP1 homology domain-containing protein n=1 Tax=Riccia sorocarpa TaxID=122646 RepID=A0ABD3I951_9MARC
MDFGKPLVGFFAVLKEMKDTRVLMECGSYESLRLHRKLEFNSLRWQLVYAFISLGPEDYRPSLHNGVSMRLCSIEYMTKKALEEPEPEKRQGAMGTNVKNKNPRWEWEQESASFPICKRHGFCYRMLINLSTGGSTVLDFFSGRIFAREALLAGRDVIYFTNSEPEAIFLKEYGKALVRYSDRVKQWFLSYKSKKVLASSSQQPARGWSTMNFVMTLRFDGNRPRLQLVTEAVAEEFNHEESNDNQDMYHASSTPRIGSRMQDSNDKTSLVEAVKQVNTGEHEENGPLALVLHHSRSLGSSHFEEIPHDVQAGINASGDNEPNTNNRPKKKVKGSLVLTHMLICLASDFMQMDNTLVKASDLLPKKLLILDTEELLLYVEVILDKTSRTAAGHVVGAKKVIRRNGVQEFMTRCLELFDIALWSCSDRNAFFEQMYYLFSPLEYDKFLFKWDQGKALDTKERWMRNNRQIRLLLSL